MAEIAVVTTIADPAARPYGFGSTAPITLSFQANTSEAIEYFVCPSAGVLKSFLTQATVTSDATKTYTLSASNVSNSAAAMLGTTLYDADPVLTAGTAAAAVLSGTAASLVVDKGDLVAVSMTGGTGSGAVAVELTFEVA
jgi:hypothetical protein